MGKNVGLFDCIDICGIPCLVCGGLEENSILQNQKKQIKFELQLKSKLWQFQFN